MVEMFNFLRAAGGLIRDFGVFGLVLIQFGVMLFLFWKLFTNHFKHFVDSQAGVHTKLDALGTSVSEVKTDVSNCKERIATIEGRCYATTHKRKTAKKIKRGVK